MHFALHPHQSQVWRPVQLLAIGLLLTWGPWLSATLLHAMPAEAALVLEVRQQVGHVTIRGSGSSQPCRSDAGNHVIHLTNAFADSEVYAEAAAFNNGSVELWQGLSGPLSISPAAIDELAR